MTCSFFVVVSDGGGGTGSINTNGSSSRSDGSGDNRIYSSASCGYGNLFMLIARFTIYETHSKPFGCVSVGWFVRLCSSDLVLLFAFTHDRFAKRFIVWTELQQCSHWFIKFFPHSGIPQSASKLTPSHRILMEIFWFFFSMLWNDHFVRAIESFMGSFQGKTAIFASF